MGSYLSDPEKFIFETRVLQQTELSNGSVEVLLEETYFYPTSGGQPHDLGWLNDIDVLEVSERDGKIIHHLPQKLTHSSISARINLQRRRDHCQQHSGQHLLSRILENLHHAETLSFHLGEEICSIDLDVPPLSKDHLALIENKCQEVILSALPVQESYGESHEWEKLELRKKPKIEGRIRIISLGNVDSNACCGTHVKNTLEILTILLLSTEKIKEGFRLYFLCGERAIQYSRKIHRKLALVQNLLQTNQEKVEEELLRLLDRVKTQYKTITQMEKEREQVLCDAWKAKSHELFKQEPHNGYVDICESRRVASAAAEALLGAGFKAVLLCYEDRLLLTSKNHPLETVWLELQKEFSIKGGGKSLRYEGGGLSAETIPRLIQQWQKKLNLMLSSSI
ncbi:MAG: alanyl-tRNA editing protein [Planctomycetota bacterium]